jgi:recombination protein RecA
MSRDSDFKSLKKELKVIDLAHVDDNITCLSTGVMGFDLAMGGGWPAGRISEIFGEWQTGKSLIAYRSIAACQRAGGIAILDDAERAFTKAWAKVLGIVTEENDAGIFPLIYTYFDSLEDGFQHMEEVANKVREKENFKDVPLLYVKDSLAASIAKSEIDEPFEKGGVAVRARSISRGLSRLTNLIANQKMAVVFVNQLRQKIGVMFGEDEETTGGKSLKFAASVRVSLRRGKKIKDGDKVLGVAGKMEVVKSKIGIPYNQVGFEMFFDGGIHPLSGLLDYLVAQDIITKPTTQSYEFGENRFRERDFSIFWESNKADVLKAFWAKGENAPPTPTTTPGDESEKSLEEPDGEDVPRQRASRRG